MPSLFPINRSCLSCVALGLLMLVSCSPNQVYKTHVEIPGKQWKQANELAFSPTIKDTSLAYNVYFDFRHVYGFQFQQLKVTITRVSPSGQEQSNDYTFTVAESKRQYKSDCSGDICDLRVPVTKNVRFPEAGQYQYKIRHTMPYKALPNVMEVGLIVEKIPQNNNQ